jgi:uncharacterized protein YcnI
MRRIVRHAMRACSVGAVAAGVIAFAGAPASAHVTVTPSVTTANARTVLTFAVPHGCDGSSTIKIAIGIPEQIISVTPTVHALWSVRKVAEELDPPIPGPEGPITERVTKVVYTAKVALPEGFRDKFELALSLPNTPGVRLAFPTIQTCRKGATHWVEIPAPGQNPGELAHPAPAFVVTAPPAAPALLPAALPAANTRDAAPAAGGDATSAINWAALTIGALGLLFAGLSRLRPAPLRSRRREP